MDQAEGRDSSPASRPFTVTFATVFAIAWPMTIAYLTTPLLGLVDTAVIGQLGVAAALGGLAMGAVMLDVVFFSFSFLRSGTTGFTAQAMGRHDRVEQQVVFVRAIVIAIACGLLIVVAGPLLVRLGLALIEPTPAVEGTVIIYSSIRIYAAPLTMVNYVILGWLLGLGKAGQGLKIQLLLNGVNIVFSILLGLTLELGVAGVAWATLIGEACAVLYGGLIVARHLEVKILPGSAEIFNRQKLFNLMAVNRDTMIRSFCLLFSFIWFTSQGSQLGETILAVNAVLMNFFIIGGYFLDGFATAAEQLVGRAIGAHYRPAFDRSIRLVTVSGFVLAGSLTAILWLFGPALIDLLTTNELIRQQARIYLPWAAITALAGVVAFQMDGVFMGATWTKDMRNMMLLSFAAFLIICWTAIPILGNHGLWLALEIFLGLRGITLWWRMKVNAAKFFG